jgi:hypothetical protein
MRESLQGDLDYHYVNSTLNTLRYNIYTVSINHVAHVLTPLLDD